MTPMPQTPKDLFEMSRERWLQAARSAAGKLLRERHSITIEDVLEVFPRPKYLHRNTTGNVFRDKSFSAVGYALAKKPSSNGRVIRRWTLSEDERRMEGFCD